MRTCWAGGARALRQVFLIEAPFALIAETQSSLTSCSTQALSGLCLDLKRRQGGAMNFLESTQHANWLFTAEQLVSSGC